MKRSAGLGLALAAAGLAALAACGGGSSSAPAQSTYSCWVTGTGVTVDTIGHLPCGQNARLSVAADEGGTFSPASEPAGLLAAYCIVRFPTVTWDVYATRTPGNAGNLCAMLEAEPGATSASPPKATAPATAPTATTSATTPPPAAPPASAPPQFTNGVAVVAQYYQDVSDQDWAAAWAIGGNNLAAENGQTEAQWIAGYQDTTAPDGITVTAASNYNATTVYATISAVQLDGAVNTYSGTYTVINGVITSAEIESS